MVYIIINTYILISIISIFKDRVLLKECFKKWNNEREIAKKYNIYFTIFFTSMITLIIYPIIILNVKLEK